MHAFIISHFFSMEVEPILFHQISEAQNFIQPNVNSLRILLYLRILVLTENNIKIKSVYVFKFNHVKKMWINSRRELKFLNTLSIIRQRNRKILINII